MNQSILVLSPSRIGNGKPEESLAQGMEWRNSLKTVDAEIVLELPIHRAGQDGWLPDNPPIEEIDKLINRAYECQCRFGSLRLPINLNQSEKNIGQEISAIDGWADLASYAEITLARLSLVHIEALQTPFSQEILTDIIDYMSEMEVAVSIGAPDLSMTALPDFFNDLFRDPDRNCGLDLRLPPQAIDRFESLDDSMDIVPLTVSLSLSGPFCPQTVQSYYERILAHFGEEIKAVVFELE